jgi:predicted PurR-regulated permease PerM
MDAIQNQLNTGADRILPLLQKALGGVVGVIGSLAFVILVPILTFLFLKDAQRLRESVLSWVPASQRGFADDVLEDVHVLLGQYIRALAMLSIITSIAYLLFFELIRLPYAVLLAVLAAPLEFIPFFGPLIGTVLVLLVALFAGYDHIWWLIVFFAAYRAFQDYWLQPYLMSKEIELHPLVVMFGALAGQQVAGLWGMFLSVPVLATLQIVLIQARKRRERRGIMPVSS